MSDICQTCGAELHIGDFPFCPHEPTRLAVVGDDIPGGMLVENGFDEPRVFYSHSEHRAALAAEGKEIRAKWAGPQDQHLKPWNAPCAQTLENAKVLLTRRREKPAPDPDVTVTSQLLDETFRVELERCE